jgi:hypothetical protein
VLEHLSLAAPQPDDGPARHLGRGDVAPSPLVVHNFYS